MMIGVTGTTMRLWMAMLAMAGALGARGGEQWVTTWAAPVQGPFPTGNASAQPNLHFAFPDPARGARDQTFRLMLLPDLWGRQVRLRFSNAFGTRPVTFDGVYAALPASGGAIVRGTGVPVRFAGKAGVTVEPGESVWSDAVTLGFVKTPVQAELRGRRLAVSFHVAGESGPMTWHAKGLTTSYVTAPGAGSHGGDESEGAFPFTTTSWYFLDALDVMAPAGTKVVVAFGDSITDGTASTLNGDDRWPDALARRLHARYGDRVVVVDAGIGGNRVAGPPEYTAEHAFSGGPAAGQRLERDVLSLSGVAAVIWLEGINDLSSGAAVETVSGAMSEIAARLRAKIPGVRITGATLTSAVGNTGNAGSAEVDRKRRELNHWIRTAKVFDAVADFDRATLDPATGGMRAEFVPESTTGGPGDHLHPNRAGYLAMAAAVDLETVVPASGPAKGER
jgi:lysophospholipase L1-like esterase